MSLTYKCVICGKPIEHPQVNQYNCNKKNCKKMYHKFLMAMHQKIFKLIKIKENIKQMEDELNGIQ